MKYNKNFVFCCTFCLLFVFNHTKMIIITYRIIT